MGLVRLKERDIGDLPWGGQFWNVVDPVVLYAKAPTQRRRRFAMLENPIDSG